MKFFKKDATVEMIIDWLKNHPEFVDAFEDLEKMEHEDDEYLEGWK